MVLPPQAKRAMFQESPKRLASLIDPMNLPSNLRDFVNGQAQMSRLHFFLNVWKYIKTNNLQDQSNKNLVKCDDKLKSIFIGKSQVELSELPMLVKLHFPKASK